MTPEGPGDSPAVNPPTTESAVAPLPPGSDAEEVVDNIDERIKKSWKEMDENDDSGMKRGSDPDEDDVNSSDDEDSVADEVVDAADNPGEEQS